MDDFQVSLGLWVCVYITFTLRKKRSLVGNLYVQLIFCMWVRAAYLEGSQCVYWAKVLEQQVRERERMNGAKGWRIIFLGELSSSPSNVPPL